MEITLGQHTVPVYPQRWAYLENRLGRTLSEFVGRSTALSGENFASFLGEEAYKALCVFLPQLPSRMPEWEFRGYPSREAWEQGEYDEQKDSSPTFPEIVEAFETIIQVNRFDVLGSLGKRLSEATERTQALQSSQSSPLRNGGSPSTSSSPTVPMRTVNGG